MSVSHLKSFAGVLNPTSFRGCHESPTLLSKFPIKTNKTDTMFGHCHLLIAHTNFPISPHLAKAQQLQGRLFPQALQQSLGVWHIATTDIRNHLQLFTEKRKKTVVGIAPRGMKARKVAPARPRVLACEVQDATCLSVGPCCYTEVRSPLSWLQWLPELRGLSCQSVTVDWSQSSFLATDMPVLWT